MRKLAYLFGNLLAILTSFIGIYGNEPAKIYVLRAPRSGSHWFFYCNNVLFKKNTYPDGEGPMSYYPYGDGGDIITAHNPYDLHLDIHSHEKDLLILLIRNYRECMLRNYKDPKVVKNQILYQALFNPLAQQKDWVLNLRMNHYFHNLRVYDMWNPEKRLIIYYEDLLQNPKETFLRLANFIGENQKEDTIQAFVDNIEDHMENSLGIYERVYRSHTRGKSFLHHTYGIGIKKSLEIDRLVMRCFPYFTRKYLKRYLLDPNE
jgi:hypothetical protein